MQDMQIRSNFNPISGRQMIQTGYNTLNYEGNNVHMSFVFMPLLKECRILSEALRNMLRINRFSEEYACLLYENMNAEDYETAMKDFHERTEEYEREPREMSDAEIAIEAKVLLSVTGEELDSEELAEMMNADVFQVEYALRKYSADNIR